MDNSVVILEVLRGWVKKKRPSRRYMVMERKKRVIG